MLRSTKKLDTKSTKSNKSHQRDKNDTSLIEFWLHGKSASTQISYRRGINQFLSIVKKALRQITKNDVQDFVRQLETANLQPASQNQKISAIRSLLAFGQKIGYLKCNAAVAFRPVSTTNHFLDKVPEKSMIKKMIKSEQNPRNKTILMLFYNTGITVSELCALKIKDFNNDKKTIIVTGRCEKRRTISVSAPVIDAMLSITHGRSDPNEPLFKSQRNNHLHTSQVFRIVQNAAEKAGIKKKITPNWLRHGHAKHALDQGCPVDVLRNSLGHSDIKTISLYLDNQPNDGSSSKYLSA